VNEETVNLVVTAVLGNGAAELREVFKVRAGSLAETLDVLERFHSLAETIRDEQAGIRKL